MFKKLLLVFLIAFALNLVWEFAHSRLYVSYRGGEISNTILFYVSAMDGIYILAFVALAEFFKIKKSTFIIIGGLLWAIALELWAQETGRWVYAAAMPIIPLLNIGLTPAVQLALTGYIASWYTFRISRN